MPFTCEEKNGNNIVIFSILYENFTDPKLSHDDENFTI